MNRIAAFFVLLTLILCNTQTIKQAVSQDNNIDYTFYTEENLISFLDSIGKLSPNKWFEEFSFLADSTLNNQLSLNRSLLSADFNKLKTAVKEQQISLDFAIRIFPEVVNSTMKEYFTDDYLPIKFMNFPKILMSLLY